MSEKEDKGNVEAKKPAAKGKQSSYADKARSQPPRISQPKFSGDCEELADCVFDCQDKQQSGKFENTIDKLANYVGSKFQHGGDIRRLIKTMEEVKLTPPPAPTDEADITEKELWKIELANFAKRKVKMDDNKQKLFSLIWGQCTSHMKAKLEAVDEFKVIDTNQDPIALLKHIKGMTYRFDGEKYLPHAITEATTRLHRLFQGRDMTNSQYLERFRSMVSVIEHYGGSVAIHPSVILEELENMTGIASTGIDDARFTEDQRKAATEMGKERCLACMFLAGADKARYGDMVTEIQNDYAKRTDSYPRTVTAAYSLMVNWIPKFSGRAPVQQQGSSFAQEGASFAQEKIECWGCGKENVVLNKCTNPACVKKWADKQARKKENQGQGEQHLNVDDPIDQDDNATSDDIEDWDDDDSFDIGEYNGYQFLQEDERPMGKVHKDCILLDSQSTHDTFYNPELLRSIKQATSSVLVHTNGGSITYTQTGFLPGYGKVWYNPKGIANILSLARVENKGHKVEYATGKFTVVNKRTGNVSVFPKQENGLFMLDTNQAKGSSFVQTVKENQAIFTPRQVAKAKEARELYGMLGRPSVDDYIGIIRNKMLPNATVEIADIKNAEMIFGKDLGSIQGKTTRSKPDTVVTNYVDLPPDLFLVHQRVTLCMDIMFVNGIPFFVSVSRNIQFTTIDRLKNRKASTLVDAAIRVCRLYQRRGFLIEVCMMDNEFENIRGAMLREGIAMNIAAPEEHVPEIERKIRTIKERIRGVIHTIPFEKIPDLVVIHAAIFSVMWLNFFPPRGGVSQTISPQAIVTGMTVDYRRHCRIPFGAYAHVHAHPNPTNNAMESRTVGGISLGPTGNVQGSYYFLSLLTGQRIKARSFTELPMPDEITKQVESFARPAEQGDNLRFQDRNGREEWMTEDDPDEEYYDANEYLPDEAEQDMNFRADDEISEGEVQDLNEEAQIPGVRDDETPGVGNNDVIDGRTPGVVVGDEIPGVRGPESPIHDQMAILEGNQDDIATPDSVGSGGYELGQNPPYGNIPEEEVVFGSPSTTASNDAAQDSSPDGSFTPTENPEDEPESEDSESDDEEEFEDARSDMDDEDEEERRVQTTTRTGRKVRVARHLFDNYQFMNWYDSLPEQKTGIPPDAYTPSVQRSFGRNPGRGHVPCPGFEGVLGYAFTQYSLKQGMRKFPVDTPKATMDEMRQLHEKHTFEPKHPDELTEREKREAIGSIIFIKEKRCGRVKARACADGRPQRLIYDKHEASSPTVKTESVILSAVQDAEERRDVAVTDIPGAFLNAELEEKVHMKLVGAIADLLIAAVPGVYDKYAVKDEQGRTVLYVLLTRALYGCLKSALQFWKHLSANLVKLGYMLNPYDTCVANKVIDGGQCTITWHVDDLKVSHKDSKVVDKVIEELEKIYGKMVTTRGKEHTYLGMDLDYSVAGEVSISMVPYMTEIVEEFPDEIPKGAKTPAAVHLFEESKDSPLLDNKRAKVFHHTVAKILWASMRARPDLLTALSFLTSRVQAPTEDDYKKLLRLLSDIEATISLKLTLSSNGTAVLKWWADASFATRADFKSQTGVSMSMGKGSVFSMARKQKLNTKSSTEAELVGADDILPQMAWTRKFMEGQGWQVARNILYQDNQSAMLMEKNGTSSSSKRTRHINIKFFFIKDRIASGEVEVEYCPTDEMVGDYFTKPLQGTKFLKFRAEIMGEKDV